MPVRVSADLHFSLEVDGRVPVTGHLTGKNSRLHLHVNDPQAFAGAGDAPAIRMLADELARRRIRVQVMSEREHLVTLGDVRAPWWQRRATRSRHIRLGSLKGAWTSAVSRMKGTSSLLPSLSMVPPETMWPIAPTMQLKARPKPTTTHDPAQGGSPRLVLAPTDAEAGKRQPIYWLADGVTTIGSASDNDIVLTGLEPQHAVVEHTDDDEFYVRSRHGQVRVHGASVRVALLRTGTRVEMGSRVFAYSRAEFADHGRPYGGRVGGEAGRQVTQPPRR